MTGVQSWLNASVATLAWCWRLSRCDGVTIGLTAHDRSLRIGDTVYAPAPGLKPSAMRFDDDWDRDTLEVEGALTSDRIEANDLRAGRWDGAVVTVLIADWTDPDARHAIVVTGALGVVSSRGRAFAAEIRAGPTWLEEGPVAPLTSPTCRATLGDRDCRVDMSGRVHHSVVTAVGGTKWTVDRDFSPDRLAHGTAIVMSGTATGLAATITTVEDRELIVANHPLRASAVPFRIALREGCDRRLATCAARFANAVNFRGEAHLPGTDILTRYPGG